MNTISINDRLGDGGLENVAILSTDASGNTVLEGAGGVLGIGKPVPVTLNDTNAAEANRQRIQTALINNALITIEANTPDDVIWIDDTIIIPSNTRIHLRCGTLQPTVRRSHFRSGNCSHAGLRAAGMHMAMIAHSSVTEEEIGTLRIVKAGANYTFSYMGAGDSAYGTGQTVSASGKLFLESPSGKKLYMRQSITNWSGVVDGTYTQQVRAIPTDMPPRAASIDRADGISTVTEAGHGRSAGDVVMLMDADTDFDGMFLIESVPTADTYTFADARAAGTGAATAYAEKNIELELDQGASILGPTADGYKMDTLMTVWILVNRLTVTGGRWKQQGAAKYCGMMHGLTKVRLRGLFFDHTVSDGFTCQGGMYDAEFTGTSSSGAGDNIFGVGCAPDDNLGAIHSPLEPGFCGVRKLTIDGLTVETMPHEPVRLFGAAGQRFDDIDIRNVSGYADGGVGIMYGTQSNLLGSTACTVGRISIRNINVKALSKAMIAMVNIGGENTTVADLTLENASYTHEGVNSDGWAYGPGVVNILNASVSRIAVKNPNIKMVSTSPTYKINLVRVGASTPQPHLIVEGGTFDAIDSIYRNVGSLTQGGSVAIRDVTLLNTNIMVQLSSAVRSVTLSNIYGTGIYRLVNSNINPAAKCVVSASGLNTNDNAAYLTAGTNWAVSGMRVDGAMLAPNPGDVFYNTNADYGAGVGTYAMGASATTRIAA